MKKASRDNGFVLAFLINMAFRFGWAILAVLMLILHFVINTSLWLIAIPVVAWILHALLITIVLFAGNKAGNIERYQKENKNPYSKSNSDYPGFTK